MAKKTIAQTPQQNFKEKGHNQRPVVIGYFCNNCGDKGSFGAHSKPKFADHVPWLRYIKNIAILNQRKQGSLCFCDDLTIIEPEERNVE